MVLALFLAITSFVAQANGILDKLKPDEGILLIDVRFLFVSDINHTDSDEKQSRDATFNGADTFMLMNLITKKTYGGRVGALNHQYGIQLIILPEGFYCVDDVTFSLIGQSYCGEPFIKVSKGKVNNAGRWRFASAKDGMKLLGSVENIDETFELAAKKFPEYFEH
jgi:hypothetical protein